MKPLQQYFCLVPFVSQYFTKLNLGFFGILIFFLALLGVKELTYNVVGGLFANYADSKSKQISFLSSNDQLKHIFYTKVLFLLPFLQEPDIRYLVENIWNSQSVLSAQEDLFDLVLVRWNKYEEWSPWNCIFLTKEEASAHAKLENVTEVLGLLPCCCLKLQYQRSLTWPFHIQLSINR